MSDRDGGFPFEADGGVESIHAPGDDVGDGSGVAEEARDGTEASPGAGAKQEFLLEAIRRRPILCALRSGPASTAELAELADQSRSTIHRATGTLEELDLIEKSDGGYALTGLGRHVTERTAHFGQTVWRAVTLKSFLNSVDVDGIPVEHFTDARITRPSPRQPHTSIQRIIELMERSDDLRMMSTVLSPLYVNVGYREMTAGMEIEAVFDEEAIDIMVSDFAQKAYETISSGNFDVYSHEGLPFELFIFDDRIGMAAHDENGVAKVLVECDDPAAVEWAIDTYEEHRAEARSLFLDEL